MTSKYDAFWTNRIVQLREMCSEARKRGFSQLLSLADILGLGERGSWSGLALIRGARVIEARMAHAVSLATTLTNDKTLAADKTIYRLVINDQPSLRIFRMNWRARRMQRNGRVLSSLSISQVAIIEEVIRPMCEHFSQNLNAEFNVNELARWIKSRFPYVQPFIGDRGMKQYSERYPEKHLINVQDSCYHLSAPKSFWIESTDSGKRIHPLTYISRMIYRVEPDWRNRIPGCIDVPADTKPVSKSLLEQYEVKPPRQFPQKKTVKAVQERSGGFSNVDYVGQVAENQALGLAGEKFVVTLEQDKLRAAGKPELAEKVKHTSVIEGDGAGYDIQSFDEEGKEIFIEVKTTTKGENEAFLVTKNELEVSGDSCEKYWLYRVFQFDVETGRGQLFRVHGAISESFVLTPILYSARR